MNKKKSVINPTTICMIICAIFISDGFYKSYEYSIGDPIGSVGGRLLVRAMGAITGAIFGLILSFVAKLFIKLFSTNSLIKEQNKILSDNNYNKNNKVNELKKEPINPSSLDETILIDLSKKENKEDKNSSK